MDINISSGGALSRIACPSHPIKIILNDDKTKAKINIDSEAIKALGDILVPDRTFTLYFREADVIIPRAII